MIPLSLKLAGFISYLEQVDLDFRGFEVACISGNNGAGKSSLLDAMTWSLFGVARKRDDSIIHSKAKTASVTLDFMYEGNIYRIQRVKTREKPSMLEFSISQGDYDKPTSSWKPLSEKGTRETEARIEQTLHMDYDTFINASFFLQGKADIFAQQRPADRKRILASILGLDVWEDYREQATDRRKKHEEDLTRLDGLINEINLELSEEPARIEYLGRVEEDLKSFSTLLNTQSAVVENLKQIETQLKEQQKMIGNLTEQRDSAHQAVARLLDLIKNRQEEQNHLQRLVVEAERIEKAHASHLEAVEQLEEWELLAHKFHELQDKRTTPLMEIETERVQLESEQNQLIAIETIVKETGGELARLKSKKTQSDQAMADAQSGIEKRAALEEKLKEKQREQAQLSVENDNLKEAMIELEKRIKSLEPVEGGACPTCGQPLKPSDREKLIATLKFEGKQSGDNYRKNQAALKTVGEIIAGLEKDIHSLAYLDGSLRDATRAHDQLENRIGQVEQQMADWSTTGAPRLSELKLSLGENTYAVRARKLLHSIDKQLNAIGYNPAAHDAARLFAQDTKSGEEEFKGLENARSALVPLEREIREHQNQLEQEKKGLTRLEKEAGIAGANYTKALARLPDVEKAYDELLSIQEQERKLRMEVGAARQKVDVLDTLRTRLAKLNGERESKTGLISKLRSVERAFGKDGVPALLIEQALPEIENQANQILDQLSDGNMSVRFSTLRDYKDKNREDKRETLDIIISDVDGTRDYEMYSGGETFRINFAIRLALSKVLAKRAGAKLQTLVIDEGFGSQDSSGRQRLIEAINTIKPDFAKILIITHMDELKDAFPTRIEVEKTVHGSTLQLN
jgi:exonuclease SbcC